MNGSPGTTAGFGRREGKNKRNNIVVRTMWMLFYSRHEFRLGVRVRNLSISILYFDSPSSVFPRLVRMCFFLAHVFLPPPPNLPPPPPGVSLSWEGGCCPLFSCASSSSLFLAGRRRLEVGANTRALIRGESKLQTKLFLMRQIFIIG